MIIGNSTTDAYPFMSGSTRRLTKAGVSLAPERVLGARLYPKVQEPTLIHISNLEKTKNYIKLNLASDTGSYIASIYFPLTADCPYVKPQKSTKYTIGYAIQEDELCGCMLGDQLLLAVLKTIPETEFDEDAFIFSPAVCFLRIEQVGTKGKLLYQGKEVKKVTFDADGTALVGSSNIGYTINTNPLAEEERIITVKGLSINEDIVLGGGESEYVEDVYIQAGKDSGIRVISEFNGITIGRLMDL